MKFIDLSIAIEDSSTAPCDPAFMSTAIDYADHKRGLADMKGIFTEAQDTDFPDGLGWAVEFIKLTSHSGTHLDAPWHYHPTMDNGKKARTIEEMPLEWGMADGVVLDFSHKSDGYKITAADVEAELQRINYHLKPLDMVFIISGAAKYWGKAEYLVRGCGMSKEATLYLLDKGVKIVGTDAWSWDRPLCYIAAEFNQTKDASLIWEGHFAGIEQEYYHIEKMTNLDKLPAFGFKVICFPIKIKNGSAGWVRPVAIIND